MAELFDREPEDILKDARAHMNPTVYDRGRVSQKLAATRRAWDGQSAVNGGALPDPFTPGAKLMSALKLGSWKAVTGGAVGVMLATSAYMALPSSPPPTAAGTHASAAVAAPRQEITEPVPAPEQAPEQSPTASVRTPRDKASSEPDSKERSARIRRVRSEKRSVRAPEPTRGEPASVAPTSVGAASVGRESRPPTLAKAGLEESLSAAVNEPQHEGASAGKAEPAKTAEANAQPDILPEVPAAKPVVDPLIEDLSLLKRAAEALHRGAARAAQALLSEHARRFPDSDARFERHTLAFAAACASGDTKSAEEHRATLLRDAPNSALSARVRAGCGMSQP